VRPHAWQGTISTGSPVFGNRQGRFIPNPDANQDSLPYHGLMLAGPVPIISFHQVTKRYGRLTAVHDLSLDIYPGEVFGYLGLNGAGKTTSIRMLLDLIRPTRGTILVSGFDSRKQSGQVRSLIGYMPGEMGLYEDLTGMETLQLFARIDANRPDPRYSGELLERFQLSETQLRKRVREYITGMKRKLGLVQAFQSDPSILILDEPTEGLDPLMQEAFYGLVTELRARGRTIFLSSHVLSEVERICTRVGLLRTGELVLNSPVDKIREMAARQVRITFAIDVDPPPCSLSLELHAAGPREWTLRTRGPIGELVQHLSGLPVLDFTVSEPRLEDILIGYYKGPER
jgi:ABC-2 type transport system ATP-binding protein